MLCCCSSNEELYKTEGSALEVVEIEGWRPEATAITDRCPSDKEPVQPEEETPIKNVEPVKEESSPELVQEIEAATSAEEHEKPKADDSIFEVTLAINDGEQLGLSCDFSDGKTFLISLARPGGAAVKWNAQNPDQALSEGCRIIRVNSIDGDAKLMLAEMHKVGPMTLLVKRAPISALEPSPSPILALTELAESSQGPKALPAVTSPIIPFIPGKVNMVDSSVCIPRSDSSARRLIAQSAQKMDKGLVSVMKYSNRIGGAGHRAKQSEYIQKTLHPIMQPLLENLLVVLPAEPLLFVVVWLRQRVRLEVDAETCARAGRSKYRDLQDKLNAQQESAHGSVDDDKATLRAVYQMYIEHELNPLIEKMTASCVCQMPPDAAQFLLDFVERKLVE